MQARYWTYDEMWAELRRLAVANSQLMRVEVIGQSRQGRDIAAVTLTDAAFGNPEDKAAVFVDANIHAARSLAMPWPCTGFSGASSNMVMIQKRQNCFAATLYTSYHALRWTGQNCI
ncbi:hypothetical protein GCM10025858_27890 [Alicyclobacillus sacchari]|nr:hypothetical protein GCM10025858_27890 [Alicyclobacillus sacchari]